MNGLNVWKWHFPVFCKFLSDKMKPFFGKARQNVKYCLNQNLLIGSLIKNGFKATLRSKTNVNLKAVLQVTICMIRLYDYSVLKSLHTNRKK